MNQIRIPNMKNILTILTMVALTTTTFAQQFTKAGDSDPQAKKVLDQVSQKYKGYSSIEAVFQLEIEFPEQPKEVQKGKMAMQGEQYMVDMDMMRSFSDGKYLYVVLHSNQQVQINDIPEDQEEFGGLSLTPQSVFNFYEKGKFVYVLANEYMDGSIPVQQIEFKPLERSSDVSKLRLEVNKNTKEIVRLKAFGKDGSRFTITVNNLKTNTKLPATMFAFNEKDYPDYLIEDLRE